MGIGPTHLHVPNLLGPDRLMGQVHKTIKNMSMSYCINQNQHAIQIYQRKINKTVRYSSLFMSPSRRALPASFLKSAGAVTIFCPTPNRHTSRCRDVGPAIAAQKTVEDQLSTWPQGFHHRSQPNTVKQFQSRNSVTYLEPSCG